MGKTHLSIGVLLLFILVEYTNLVEGNEVLAAVLILTGSLLPDLDSSNSIFGKKFKPLKWLFKHRGILHSIFAMVAFTVLVKAIFYTRDLSLVFMAGYASHLVTDSLTKEGTRLFYPSRYKIKGPLKVGSFTETLIFFILVVLTVYLVV